MKNTVLGISRLKSLLEKSEVFKLKSNNYSIESIISKLSIESQRYYEKYNIRFRIDKSSTSTIIVVDIILPKRKLVEAPNPQNIIDEMFPYLEGLLFNGRLIEPYKSPIEMVTPDWIKESLEELKVTLKQLCNDTGVSNAALSKYINAKKPLTQNVKAMFYYYIMNERHKRKLPVYMWEKVIQKSDNAKLSYLNGFALLS